MRLIRVFGCSLYQTQHIGTLSLLSDGGIFVKKNLKFLYPCLSFSFFTQINLDILRFTSLRFHCSSLYIKLISPLSVDLVRLSTISVGYSMRLMTNITDYSN